MAYRRSEDFSGRVSMNPLKDYLMAFGLSMFVAMLLVLALQFFGAAK
jgi:hypothetical protein